MPSYRLYWDHLLLVGVCLLSLFLVSCQKEKISQKYVIGFSQCTTGDAWRQMMHQEMIRELSFHPELKMIIKNADNDSEKQIAQIRELVEQKVDLLIISPNEAEPITPIVEQIFSSGLPILLIDRKTNSKLYTAYIGADNYKIGQAAGEYAAFHLKNKGEIIEIFGLPGSSPAINRHKGFKDAIQKYPELKVVGEVNGQWEADFVLKALPEVLLRHPEADLIYAHNDRMAMAAYRVLQSKDLADRIDLIGIDGLPGPNGGVQSVEDGIFDATLLYPTGGEEAIRTAAAILNGQAFEKEILLNTTVIDARNARLMKMQSNKILKEQESIERLQEMVNQQSQVFQNQRVALYILITSLIITILLGAWLYKLLRDRGEVNKKLELQNEEIRAKRNQIMEISEKVKAVTKAKFRFFTNISHEFRTPLTLILGTVESLLTSGRVKKKDNQEDLGLMRQNALRLLRLINQLMDFRKIENGKMQLRVSENDLVAFVRDIMKAYRNVAGKRNIDFRLFVRENRIPLWFDANLLDKVLFNLLSNAFKFTKDGGRIHLSIEINPFENQAYIILEDNGRGMSEEHVEHAFDRFYQGEHYNAMGTGLGLSLSKELIELHGGKIHLWSKKQEGTRFEICLLLGKDHFPEDQMAKLPINTLLYDEAPIYVEGLLPNQDTTSWPVNEKIDRSKKEIDQPAISLNQKEYQLLIIEDHDDLRQFLKHKLSAHYEIYEAGDGQSGMETALKVVPDLIICDIMLPGKDGLSMTKLLKSDLRTSHIPIILLTARTTMEQKIEGIQTGADAYLTKPFNLNFLQENIKNLLINRALLKKHFKLGEQLPDEITANISKLDRRFMEQFADYVEQNYFRQDLGMPDLMREFGLSRAQLYRKVKALFNQSVIDYIQNVRLKTATDLLDQGDLSISEIAYQVGYTSPSYFSTAFKSHFQCTPSEFRNQS